MISTKKAVAARIAGSKVTVSSKKILVKKAGLPDVPDQAPVIPGSKTAGKASAVKVTKTAKTPAASSEPKVRAITRTGRMRILIEGRQHTDVEMYAELDKEFGPGKKYLATYRHNLNVIGKEADPKFVPYTRLMRGQDGTLAEWVAGAAPGKKEKREKIKAKITLAVSKLPKE
jgi:hypothetical protein